MKNLIDQLDLLKKVIETELILRASAVMERQRGIENGPMVSAHTASVQAVVDASKSLVEASER